MIEIGADAKTFISYESFKYDTSIGLRSFGQSLLLRSGV